MWWVSHDGIIRYEIIPYIYIACLENDELYGWGSGLYGECGVGEYSDTL